MNTHINNDLYLELPNQVIFNYGNLYKHTVISINDVGKGFDMYEEKKMLKAMLDIVIDGVSVSTVGNERATAGKKILDCIMLKYSHLIDKDTIKQIQSIIESADEVDSPAYRL